MGPSHEDAIDHFYRAFDEGMQAFDSGAPLESNPYPQAMKDAFEGWISGWKVGMSPFSKAFGEGMRAFLSGKGMEENPYPELHSDRQVGWEMGWEEAEAQDRENLARCLGWEAYMPDGDNREVIQCPFTSAGGSRMKEAWLEGYEQAHHHFSFEVPRIQATVAVFRLTGIQYTPSFN